MMRRSSLLALVITLLLTTPAVGKERFFTDEIGRTVKISYPPMKIISLAPSITEILFALGLNAEIQAVTNFCDYPEAASKKARIGGFINPNMEKIVSLKPELIIAIRDGNRWESIQTLNDLGFSVFVVNPKDFDGVMRTVRHIAEIVGRQEKGDKILKNMLTKKQELITFTQSFSRPKVFFQVGDAPMVTVGRGTLADDLIRLAGGRSISEDELVNYPSYSIEIILEKSPDIIIMSSMDPKKDYMNLAKKWENWKSVPAVKMNAVYVIDSNIVDRPTPRIEKGLEALVRMIHPEAFREKITHPSRN